MNAITDIFDPARYAGVRKPLLEAETLPPDCYTSEAFYKREVETIFLRSDTDFDQATFSWSLDGETWKPTAHTYQLTFGSWRGNRPGLFCWNAYIDELTEAGWVDVDWFLLTHPISPSKSESLDPIVSIEAHLPVNREL